MFRGNFDYMPLFSFGPGELGPFNVSTAFCVSVVGFIIIYCRNLQVAVFWSQLPNNLLAGALFKSELCCAGRQVGPEPFEAPSMPRVGDCGESKG